MPRAQRIGSIPVVTAASKSVSASRLARAIFLVIATLAAPPLSIDPAFAAVRDCATDVFTVDVKGGGNGACRREERWRRSDNAAGRLQTPTPQDSRPAFSDWLDGVRTEALSRGIRQEIVDAALSNIDEPLPVVLERDRAQAEIVLPLEAYVRRRLTLKFIKAGREAYASHRTMLESIGKAYGVSPAIIAAIWGIESNYGRFSGVRPTVAALATLAWDPRRSTFFRGELFNALEILNNGDIELADMKGSWAGAMGQVQFMPSSYLQYAEDYDGDGHKDIWSTPADVIASIANYLTGRGWKAGQMWGREVRITREVARTITNKVERRNGGCRATRDMTVFLPVRRWQELGVRLPDGKALPASMPEASLVSGSKQHFLVYSNYDALLEYNCAHSYAISVGMLADRIASGGRAAARAGRAGAARKR